MFWIGLVIGLIVGTVMGAFLIALLMANKEYESKREQHMTETTLEID